MKMLLGVKDIMNICEIKETKAYKIMKEINKQMTEDGYLTIRGKVNTKYFCDRLGLDIERVGA